jgi:CheY-like chemotaxis protein
VARMALAARAASSPPFTVALCGPGDFGSFPTDGQASRPADEDDAHRLIAGSIRLRLPSRVLLVDDSPTMRSIMRKILAATRFPLEVTEAGEGGEALALARAGEFDFVFFDHNLPGVSGLEAIAELRRAKRYPGFVLMTSADDEALAEKANARGIAFLKKPFYPADLESVLCRFCGLRALKPVRG